MKKSLLLLASAVLLLSGCAKDRIAGGKADGDQVTTTFIMNLATAGTKSLTDNDGHAANVNHWIMEVRDAQDDLFTRVERDVESGTLVQTYELKLFKNQSYTLQFWADTKGAYNTDDLTAISKTGLTANADSLDAFSANVLYTSITSESKTVTLYRPFAQLNIITCDLAGLKAQVVPETYEKYAPEELEVVATVPTTFNVQTQQAGEASEQTLTATASYADFSAGAPETTLFMDYIFASKEEADILNIDFDFTSNSQLVNYEFKNIPLQRNYRTNIKGNLMSNDSEWTVTIDPEWTGDGTTDEEGDDPYLVNYYEAGSIAAANEALKTNNAVSIENPEDIGTDIVIPAEQNGKEVSIKIAGASGADIVIKDAEQGASVLNLESDAKNLDINTPNTHFNVNAGDYDLITSKTSDNTLVIGENVKVAKIEATKGNVEIHGIVNALTRANGVKAEMYASDRATLINHMNLAKADETVNLVCDIDLAGEDWTPIMAGTIEATATIDGCNHAIKNMIVKGGDAGAGFLFCNSGIVKNLTIDNATVEGATEDKGNMYGIVAGYAYGNATFENITVKNSKIHAFGKVSAILGMAADGNGTTVVKNCKVENTEIIGCYNVANYVGLVQNAIVLEGCTSTNVEKKLGGRYGEDSYVTFDNVKVIDNSDPANPKYVLSSGKYWKYTSGSNVYYYSAFADCYNDIHYVGWKALDGTVDALVFNTPDTPELIDLEPVATIGSTKYYDLPSALAAATEGQTVQILEAGDYATNNLSTKAAVVEATVDGVVFNHPTAATSWVASCQGTTIKNITWNVGNAHHQYIQNTNLENCTVNGLLCTHSTNKFKDCTFINEDGYNFWVYGNVYTEFDNCTFSCPGKDDGAAGCGSAINCYNEGAQAHTSVLVVKNCTFTAKEASNKYSAIYVKPETAFDIRITNSTCNDKFCTGTISGSKLWNIKSDKEGTTVTIDDVKVYPFCSKDADGNYHITNAAGLLQFHDLYAAEKVASTAKVYIDNDIDFTGKTWTALDWHADKTTKGFALFDGQNHTIKNFTVNGQGMFSRWAGGATPYFKDIVFDGAKNVTSTLNVSLFCGQTYQNAKIENVTIKNSQFEGTYKVAPFVGTVYDENGTAPTLTMKDCKVENTTVRGTSYDFDICGMVAWVYEENNDKIAFEGNNVVKDVTLYSPKVTYDMCAKIYHNGDTAYDEVANVSVSNVNVVIAQ